jgi:DNA-directed RNA polymerase subunit RPC12/RpoP
MPGRKSDLRERWLALSCPACRRKLRIREAYAHLRGRCPECGYRIQAPKPRPAEPYEAFSAADEPLGLVPIEEEWPEPARVDRLAEEDPGDTYTLDAPLVSQPLPKPIGADDDLFFQPTARYEAEAPAPPAKANAPYALHQPQGDAAPKAPPVTYHLSRSELEPERPPEPPQWPLWQGIYFFPWRPDAVLLWLTLSVKMGLVAALLCIMTICKIGYEEGSAVHSLALPLLVPLLSLGALWTGTYCTVQFLGVLEETAAGNDRVRRPEWTLAEGMMKFFYLAWVAMSSLIPSGLLAVLTFRLLPQGPATELALLVPAVVTFPVLLLSSLSSPAAWMLLNGRFISRLLAKPSAVLALCIPPFLLLVPCLVAAGVMFEQLNPLLGLANGFLWSACFLIYARLLGRIAWYTTLHQPGATKKRKRPRPAPE